MDKWFKKISIKKQQIEYNKDNKTRLETEQNINNNYKKKHDKKLKIISITSTNKKTVE